MHSFRYGLGGSSIAMFGRVGGGIYTKAADVGADLVGKVEAGIPEDDPRNPAVIADNVGDNVGDIAGMGADLFGSFAEATCAAMVLTTTLTTDTPLSWAIMLFPVLVVATGMVVSLVIAHIAFFRRIQYDRDVETALKIQLWGTTILQTFVVFLLAVSLLPSTMKFETDSSKVVHWYSVAVAICTGLWSGLFIGLVTEYYTSNSYRPVREVAESCKSGTHACNVDHILLLRGTCRCGDERHLRSGPWLQERHHSGAVLVLHDLRQPQPLWHVRHCRWCSWYPVDDVLRAGH